jgi:hypothetical protein
MSQFTHLLFKVADTIKVSGRGVLLQPWEWFGVASVGDAIELRLTNGQVVQSRIKEITTVRHGGRPAPVAIFAARVSSAEGLQGADVCYTPSEGNASGIGLKT